MCVSPPHRGIRALDAVTVDSGPSIKATLTGNPLIGNGRRRHWSGGLAVRKLVSGMVDPIEGTGLWMTIPEMRKPGRKMWTHLGSGLPTLHGHAEPKLREAERRQVVMIRLTVRG